MQKEPAQEPDSPARRCGGPGCDMTCCQPVEEPVKHKHQWISTGGMEPGKMRCIHCGAWGQEAQPVQEPMQDHFPDATKMVQEPLQEVVAERKRLLSLAKRRADHEASAAAHHAGRWHAAHEYHLTRHTAMLDLIALLAEPQEPVSGPT